MDPVILGTSVGYIPISLEGELSLERMKRRESELSGMFKCIEPSETVMLKGWHLWGRW